MIPTNHLPPVAALACAALLSACGGGAPDENPIAPASAEAIQSFNELSTYCGAKVMLPTHDTAVTLQQRLAYMVTVNRVSYYVNTAYAANGWSPVADLPTRMDIPMGDMRGLTADNTISIGFASPGVKMGAAMLPVMPSAAITCVRGLNGHSTISWSSREAGTLDVTSLPAPAVDGFEWLANFEPFPGSVFFTIEKTKVDPATARICRRPPGAVAWSCSVPSLVGDSNTWTFSLGSMSRGIYVLVANKPAASQ